MLVAIYFDWQHAGGYDHGIAPVAIAVFAAYLATKLLAIALKRKKSTLERVSRDGDLP